MRSRRMAWLAMFVAMTVVGAAIKIPAVIGSIALDSFPALLAAVLLGGPSGAAVAGAGHLLSALIGGMPLGPLHVLIAFEMAFLSFAFSLLYKSGKRWQAAFLFILGNSFAAPLPFLFLLNKAFYLSLVPSLLIGSIFNAVIAVLVIPRLFGIAEQLANRGRTSQ
ncbi:ECF transporter S component [Mesobacillus foraminis]|uniref:ECF transporter S component n=1 Tax=Mesobacillus foraminis TaxID=279826 RepID=UPI001BE6DEBF|nr:ECF transporter S component [Mesobacillus foraminis]MBT2758190.1 ECF transporter S component [Mesobacillus foraminis]